MATGRLISGLNSSIVHTVTTSTVAGTLKRIGEALVAKSMNDATVASGSDCAFMVPTADVFQLPHSVTTGSSGVIGDYAYFVGSGTNITSLSTGNGVPVGIFNKDAAQADTTCEIRMSAGGAAGDLSGVVDGFTMNEGADIEAGTTTGTKIGAAATQKIGLWGAAPIVQPASAAQADQGAMTTVGGNTGTSGVGLTLIGDTTTLNQAANLMNDLVALQEDITALDVLVTEIRTALVNAGIMKGAA